MARLRLGRFSLSDKITTDSGTPTTVFGRWLNDSVSAIQAFVNDQAQLVADITFSVQQAGIAITTANEAKAAQAVAAKEAKLISSYVTPGDVLSAVIDPADATKAIITIANHSRVYGDAASVAVTGGTIGGLELSTGYYITYQDAEFDGGTVVYTAQIDYSLAGQGSARHLVGVIMTPASGATEGSEGNPSLPPGVPYWKFPPTDGSPPPGEVS